MWTLSFWKQALERAIKSAVQLGAIAVGADGANLLDGFDYRATLGVMLAAAVASILTSILTSGVGQPASPSAVAVTPVSTPRDRAETPMRPGEFD